MNVYKLAWPQLEKVFVWIEGLLSECPCDFIVDARRPVIVQDTNIDVGEFRPPKKLANRDGKPAPQKLRFDVAGKARSKW